MNFVEPIRNKEDINIMCDYLRSQSQRNYLIFLTGINTNLRVSDLAKLKRSDIRGYYINVIEKKTGKSRKVKMNALLKKEIDRWISDMDYHEYLFKSRKGKNKPLTREAVYYIIKKAGDELGLENIGTHTMRKTFGYHYYQKTKDIATLMVLFNHSSPKITKIYLGLNQDHQDKAMTSFRLGK